MSFVSLARLARRRLLGSPVKRYEAFFNCVSNRVGLEIGGPSIIFADDGILPIYRYVKTLDNCVYSSDTIWEGHRGPGQTFEFHPRKPKGLNFICEASDLAPIPAGGYEFILASHSLEHSANPLKVLGECKRVTKPGGAIIVVLPHYRYTFDHRRTPTPLGHMIEDYEHGAGESDLTHLPEILALHDLSLDKPAGTLEQFRARCVRNMENRCLHHHVFDEHNAPELIKAAGYQVSVVEFVKPCHLLVVATSLERKM